LRDSRLVEQPVGHEQPLAATIQRVVVRSVMTRIPIAFKSSMIVLETAELRAVVVRVRSSDDRTFHVGVGRVRRAQSLWSMPKARIVQLTHRATMMMSPTAAKVKGSVISSPALWRDSAPAVCAARVCPVWHLSPGEGNARPLPGLSRTNHCGAELLIPETAIEI